MQWRNKWGAVSLVVWLGACGGGGGDNPPSLQPQLQAQLVAGGTYLRCDNAPGTSIQVERVTAGITSTASITCPSTQVLAGDYKLSQWTLQKLDADTRTVSVLATTATALPAPIVLDNGNGWIVLRPSPLAEGQVSGLELQLIGSDGRQAASVADPTVITQSALTTSTTDSSWRWKATSGGVEYLSASVTTLAFTETDLGYWGALAVGDTSGDTSSELLGMTTTANGETYAGYAALGLDTLFANRDFRDVRIADLDNDGLDDVVANVYGAGCSMIGLRRKTGGYDFNQPLRTDGSCIGGHGETLLVANFDGDGLLDIVLPAYERFDFLKNQGGGKFVEIADSLGISFSNYLPHVEGATAVDLDLDGDVDIVIANEVLVNDGTGHFSRMPSPFGATAIADEGMSVLDLDGDGIFDIVKNNPSRGPRVFWGASDRLHFQDAGWLLGGDVVLTTSYGVAAGNLTGNTRPDLVIAGGAPAGLPPQICVQPQARQLSCLKNVIPEHPGAWQDLLLITDLNADGGSELVSRYGTIRTYAGAPAAAEVFRIDLRDASGHRNQHGRSMRATCTVDDSPLGLNFVDGGNGYMAQSDYIVPFSSAWCPSIWLDVATKLGAQRFGPLKPGTHVLKSSG